MGFLAEEDEYADECNEERFVPMIKRHIDEYALGIW